EIAVDAVGRRRLEVLVQLARLVVDAGVEAELLHHVFALLLPAGDADRAAAFQLRDLADDTPDRARCRGDDDRLTGLGLADVEQADPCRDSWHAKHPKESGRRHLARIDLVQPR